MDLKNLTKTVKEKISTEPVVIYILAVILALLMLWFVVNNFVFLTAHLNDAFGQSLGDVEVEREMFDREEFESLGFEAGDSQ